jgi:protein-S-isoprenylcysteine O-methyltransferase Ste14
MVFALGGFLALLVVPAFDRRFGWSLVPPDVAVAGDVLVALGFLVTFFVCKVNSYAASTIQVAKDQKVISTGPYALVRHPMYAGVLVLLVGMPLALGSWLGLVVLAFLLPVLIWRLLEEEKFLAEHLPGYTDYQRKVRYRLLPSIW